MKHIITNSSGFSALEVALFVIVMGIIGGSSYYVYNSQQDSKELLTNSESAIPTGKSLPSLDKTYQDQVGNFSVNYPGSWSIETTTNTADEYAASSDTKITSPDGTVLHLRGDNGGKGGACEPDPADIPFTKGNTCSSFEYLSVEKSGITNLYYGQSQEKAGGLIDYTYQKTDIVLITSRYMDTAGKETFTVGLTQSNPSEPVITEDPKMGLYGPFSYFSVIDMNGNNYPNIYAYATGDSKAFLSSDDVLVIKAILKSMTVAT